jgi:heme A synthase
MDSRRILLISLALSILIEYVLGGFVTFDDPSNAGFALNSFSLAWPAVLPFIHRAFAIFLFLLWLVGSFYLRGTRAFRASHITLGLILIQIVIGALIPITLSSSLNSYIIVAHFSVAGLVVIAGGFTLYLGWISTPASNKQQLQPSVQ